LLQATFFHSFTSDQSPLKLGDPTRFASGEARLLAKARDALLWSSYPTTSQKTGRPRVRKPATVSPQTILTKWEAVLESEGLGVTQSGLPKAPPGPGYNRLVDKSFEQIFSTWAADPSDDLPACEYAGRIDQAIDLLDPDCKSNPDLVSTCGEPCAHEGAPRRIDDELFFAEFRDEVDRQERKAYHPTLGLMPEKVSFTSRPVARDPRSLFEAFEREFPSSRP
jgi:hypothetical protein